MQKRFRKRLIEELKRRGRMVEVPDADNANFVVKRPIRPSVSILIKSLRCVGVHTLNAIIYGQKMECAPRKLNDLALLIASPGVALLRVDVGAYALAPEGQGGLVVVRPRECGRFDWVRTSQMLHGHPDLPLHFPNTLDEVNMQDDVNWGWCMGKIKVAEAAVIEHATVDFKVYSIVRHLNMAVESSTPFKWEGRCTKTETPANPNTLMPLRINGTRHVDHAARMHQLLQKPKNEDVFERAKERIEVVLDHSLLIHLASEAVAVGSEAPGGASYEHEHHPFLRRILDTAKVIRPAPLAAPSVSPVLLMLPSQALLLLCHLDIFLVLS